MPWQDGIQIEWSKVILSPHQKFAIERLAQGWEINEGMSSYGWRSPNLLPVYEIVQGATFDWLKKHAFIEATHDLCYVLSDKGRDLAVRLGYMKPRPSTLEDYK